MTTEQETSSTRRSRGSRRRPDLPPPAVEKIPPRSGLSRAEVIANQRARIFEGFAAALVYHGYEDTKVTDIVELSGVSRATFYERFESKELCFAAAYEDGIERLAVTVEDAAQGGERGWTNQLSAGLRAGLEFLAAQPTLAHLLFVEALAAARPARLEHERSLERLAEALRPPARDGQGAVSEETARMLAGGLASHLSSRVLAGEAEKLTELHDTLLQYLLAPSLAALRTTDERRAAAL
jgi:AcrR family transcriptional regulator